MSAATNVRRGVRYNWQGHTVVVCSRFQRWIPGATAEDGPSVTVRIVKSPTCAPGLTFDVLVKDLECAT